MSTLATAIISPAFAIGKALFGGASKAAETARTPLPPTPAPRRDESAVRDALFSRQGTRSNRRTGASGAEPGAKKTRMGQ